MDSSLLDTDPESGYEKLLLEAMKEKDIFKSQEAATKPTKIVIPKPGFCIKTTTDKKEKVFINICKSENVPPAKDISDADLLELLDSDDPSGFRIPMSLGEPHAEVDKSGKGCTAFDVVVNPAFYEKLHSSQVMMGFCLTVVLEGLEYKNNIALDREWKILKNKKFVGSLPEQNVRTQSKPFIMEMDSSDVANDAAPKKSLISEVSSSDKISDERRKKAPEPRYSIIQDPPEGHPDFLVAEIQLPNVKSAQSMTLDIGEDRIVLATRTNVYGLDIYLPYDLVQEDCGAQFNRKNKVLTLTMPVQPVS